MAQQDCKLSILWHSLGNTQQFYIFDSNICLNGTKGMHCCLSLTTFSVFLYCWRTWTQPYTEHIAFWWQECLHKKEKQCC